MAYRSGGVKNVTITANRTNVLSRKDMLEWVNSTLKSNILKIEELGSGAAYCQLMDILFPGTIPMQRVKFVSRDENDAFFNMKMLQRAFDRTGVTAKMPIEKLVKCKFLDNFEFIQWFKLFFDANKPESKQKYDPISARSGQTLGMGCQKEASENRPQPSMPDFRRAKSMEVARVRAQKLANLNMQAASNKTRSKSMKSIRPGVTAAQVFHAQERVRHLCRFWADLEQQSEMDIVFLNNMLNLMKTKVEDLGEPYDSSLLDAIDIIAAHT